MFVVVAAIYNVVSTLLNWILIYAGMYYIIANAISYVFGVILAYLLNTKFVFKKKYSMSGVVKFSTVYASNFVMTLLLVASLVEFFQVNLYVAPIIVTAISSVYNFTLSKLFVYKTGEHKEP